MAWYRPEDVDPEDFDPEANYTNSQLEAFATAFLKRDRRENKHLDLGILFQDQLDNRNKREVPVDALEIDPTLTQSMQEKNGRPGVHKGDGQRIFSRTHKEGRKVNSLQQRLKGSSFYKN